MKTLKFKPHLVEMILNGTKTITWRLFDDKDLQVNDHLALINSGSLEKFAEARITAVKEKKLGGLEVEDYKGHEPFASTDDMLAHYREYYGPEVSLDTRVKMITFELVG